MAEEREQPVPSFPGGCGDEDTAAAEREVPETDVGSDDEGGERDSGGGGVQVQLGLWKRPACHGRSSKVSFYSTKQALGALFSTIVRDLPARALFERSCFGAYMRMDWTGATCGAAIHSLLSREVNMSDARRDEVWFRVGEKNIRFSKIEFALVTGLRFGINSFDTTAEHTISDDSLYYRHYPRVEGVLDVKLLSTAMCWE